MNSYVVDIPDHFSEISHEDNSDVNKQDSHLNNVLHSFVSRLVLLTSEREKEMEKP